MSNDGNATELTGLTSYSGGHNKASAITWQELVYAICWQKMQAESLALEDKIATATAFYCEHADNAPFVAAARLAVGPNGAPFRGTPHTNAQERCEAEAFMSQFPEEMHAWYDYNAGLEEPFFGLERMDPACRCLPRHCSSCPVVIGSRR